MMPWWKEVRVGPGAMLVEVVALLLPPAADTTVDDACCLLRLRLLVLLVLALPLGACGLLSQRRSAWQREAMRYAA